MAPKILQSAWTASSYPLKVHPKKKSAYFFFLLNQIVERSVRLIVLSVCHFSVLELALSAFLWRWFLLKPPQHGTLKSGTQKKWLSQVFFFWRRGGACNIEALPEAPPYLSTPEDFANEEMARLRVGVGQRLKHRRKQPLSSSIPKWNCEASVTSK